MRTGPTLAAVVVVTSACGGAVTTAPSATTTASDSGTPAPGAPHPKLTFVTRLVGGECLPQKLPTDASGETTCVVVETLASAGSESACDGTLGLSEPDADTLALLRADTSADSTTPLCTIAQLPQTSQGGATCTTSSAPGWCYRTGAASAPECAQSIAFSPGGAPVAGAEVWLACP